MSKEVNQNTYSLQDLDLKEALRQIYLTALHLNFPVALWRMPLDNEISLIVDLSGKAKSVKPELEELGKGFMAAPFQSEKDEAEFISADLIFSSVDCQLNVNPVYKDSWTTELFFQRLNAKNLTDPKSLPVTPYANKKKITKTTKEDYLGLVLKGIAEINQGTFKKVVLSRTKVIDLDPEFDIIGSFLELCNAYPGAFVNLFQLPGNGLWMGATPELLIGQDSNDIFKTVSLAGTQKAELRSNPLEIGWTQKEIEEQAMVGRYIINCFKMIRLREFEEDGPKTVRAANLYHLKSEYIVNTREVNFPQLGTVMLKLLHPTSAVCGMPKASSMEFILEEENYDRSFYSGFIGPVNINNGSHLFVNLRCMQIVGHQGILYAGGGVTEHSDPEKEWQETEMKFRTLLDIIE